MELSHLNDDASLVPLVRVGSDLILDSYIISDFQWWEVDSMLREALRIFHMSVA